MPPEKIHIGTSGWNFGHWVGAFYPADIAGKDMLPAYAKTFHTVELNNSFYGLPDQKSVKTWTSKTPEKFVFSCKASRYITHMKKLKDPQDGINHLFAALKPFGQKLGPILFQLPPNWHVNTQRLEAFLAALPDNHSYTFEFRDHSWLCDKVYEMLQEHAAALCFYDYQGFRSPEIPTADFIYVRLHGPGKKAYEGSYDGRTLARYAQKFLNWAKDGKDIYCYFDNDQNAYAPFNAQNLMKSIERQP